MYGLEFSYVDVCSEINMTYRIIELVTSLDIFPLISLKIAREEITNISIFFSISY